ncbi:hypothetical protein ACFE04_012147 [Oxalis oulophora]
MSSFSLSNHCCLSSLLQTQNPKSPSLYYNNNNNNNNLSTKSLHSQFHGVKLPHSASISVPRSSSTRPSIVAKLTEGQIPPNFTLKDQDGRSVSLSKFKGKPVVVYFYPADETPGCTKQACAFRDSYEKFKKAGAAVVGISGDSPSSHKAFATKYKLPYTLLADEGNKVRKEWEVPGDFFGALPGRQTYVLDRNGVVRLIYNNQFEPEKHIDETLKILKSV